MKNTIQILNKGNNLSYDETKNTFEYILNGKLTKEESFKFLTALNNKKATVEELAAEVDSIHSSNLVSKSDLSHFSVTNLKKCRTNSLNF